MIEKIVIYGPSFSRTWALNSASHNVPSALGTRRQINNDVICNVILKVLHSFTPHMKLNNFSINDANFMKFKPYQFQPRCISYIQF